MKGPCSLRFKCMGKRSQPIGSATRARYREDDDAPPRALLKRSTNVKDVWTEKLKQTVSSTRRSIARTLSRSASSVCEGRGEEEDC